MARRSPPILQPGPLSWQSAGELNRFFDDVSRVVGGIVGRSPVQVQEIGGGLQISISQPSPGVNAQSGSSYTISGSDYGLLVTIGNSSAIAVTVAQAGQAQFPQGWWCYVENRFNTNNNLLTITPTVSTIDGASSLAIPPGSGVYLISDGTNWYTERGMTQLYLIDITGTPGPFTGTWQIQTNTADGLSIAQATPGSGIVQMDLLAASLTQIGTVNLSTQDFKGIKLFTGATGTLAGFGSNYASFTPQIVWGNGPVVGYGGIVLATPADDVNYNTVMSQSRSVFHAAFASNYTVTVTGGNTVSTVLAGGTTVSGIDYCGFILEGPGSSPPTTAYMIQSTASLEIGKWGTGGGGDTFAGGICVAFGAAGSAAIVIGTTPVTGGTAGDILQVGAGPVLSQVGTSGSGNVVLVGGPTLNNVTIDQAANGNTALTLQRATDSGPTGAFETFQSHAGATLWNVDTTGTLTAGTVPTAQLSGLGPETQESGGLLRVLGAALSLYRTAY